MTLVRYEPWSVVARLQRHFDQAFNDHAGILANGASQVAWSPSVDIHQEADKFVVRADLPGVEPKDIDVTAENGVLTVSGERKFERNEEHKGNRALRARRRPLRAPLHAAGERADRQHPRPPQQWRARVDDPEGCGCLRRSASRSRRTKDQILSSKRNASARLALIARQVRVHCPLLSDSAQRAARVRIAAHLSNRRIERRQICRRCRASSCGNPVRSRNRCRSTPDERCSVRAWIHRS